MLKVEDSQMNDKEQQEIKQLPQASLSASKM